MELSSLRFICFLTGATTHPSLEHSVILSLKYFCTAKTNMRETERESTILLPLSEQCAVCKAAVLDIREEVRTELEQTT
jgi:hypothetical protein